MVKNNVGPGNEAKTARSQCLINAKSWDQLLRSMLSLPERRSAAPALNLL
jgi:hypothetical protein